MRRNAGATFRRAPKRRPSKPPSPMTRKRPTASGARRTRHQGKAQKGGQLRLFLEQGALALVRGMKGSARLRLVCQYLGANVARLRIHLDMTQVQFAARLGVSRRYLQRLERGKMVPSFSIFVEMAQILGVTEPDLLVPAKIKRAKRGRPRILNENNNHNGGP